jgi:hypothetical protein
MTELLSNELFRVTLDDGIARVTRTPSLAPAPTEMAAVYGTLMTTLRRAGTRRVLIDLRGGPAGRNDPEFERASEDWRRALATEYERAAILVRTAVGKLHIQRLGREIGRAPSIFMDEGEALAFLRAP